MQPTPTPTPTHTHTLSLPQIQFINHFLYSKPHSFHNPHTLYNKIQHTHSFKSLRLDYHLIKQYTNLLYKKELSAYVSKLKNNGKSPVPAPAPPQPPPPAPASPYKPRRFKKFTNFLKKTFKKKSVAPAPAPPPPPKLSIPSPVNPNTHRYSPSPGYKAPHQSPRGKPRFAKSLHRASLSTRRSSSSSTPQRRSLNSSSNSNRSVSVTGYRGKALRPKYHRYRRSATTLKLNQSDVVKRLKEKRLMPAESKPESDTEEQKRKDSEDLKRVLPVWWGLKKAANYIAPRTKKATAHLINKGAAGTAYLGKKGVEGAKYIGDKTKKKYSEWKKEKEQQESKKRRLKAGIDPSKTVTSVAAAAAKAAAAPVPLPKAGKAAAAPHPLPKAGKAAAAAAAAAAVAAAAESPVWVASFPPSVVPSPHSSAATSSSSGSSSSGSSSAGPGAGLAGFAPVPPPKSAKVAAALPVPPPKSAKVAAALPKGGPVAAAPAAIPLPKGAVAAPAMIRRRSGFLSMFTKKKKSSLSSKPGAIAVAGPASPPKGKLANWFSRRFPGTKKNPKGKGKGLLSRSSGSSSSSASSKSAAAIPSGKPKVGLRGWLSNTFSRSKPGTQKKSKGKGLLARSSGSSSSARSSSARSSSSRSSSASSLKSVAAAAAAPPPPKKPIGLIIPEDVLKKNIYNEANRWIIDNLKNPNFPASVRQALLNAAKNPVKNTKISMMKTVNMNFIAEQLELLNQYEQELADYNKAIGVSQPAVVGSKAAAPKAASGAAAAGPGIPKLKVKGASVSGTKLPSPPKGAAAAASGWSSDDDSPKPKPKIMVKIKPAAAAAAASGAAAAGPGSSKIKGSVKIVPVVVTPPASPVAAGPGSSKIKGSVKIVPVVVTPPASPKVAAAAAAAAAAGWSAPIPDWVHQAASSYHPGLPKAASATPSPPKAKGHPGYRGQAAPVSGVSWDSSKSSPVSHVWSAAPVVGLGWGSPSISPAKKSSSSSSSSGSSRSSRSSSPKVATGAKAAVIINKYARMIVKYNQTNDPSDEQRATAFYNKNKIGELPRENIDYIPRLVESLQNSPSTLELIKNNEKLLDDLADFIIKQKDDNYANTLYPLYDHFLEGEINEAIQYFLDNKLYYIDTDILNILHDNPTVSSRLKELELEESPVAAASSWSSDDGSKRKKPKIMIKMKSPKSLSATAASAAVPKLAAYSGESKVKRVRRPVSASAATSSAAKSIKSASASSASADSAGNSFIDSILKNAKKQDKRSKVLKKYYRLIRERKTKEANAYSIKHNISKIPGAFDKFDSFAVLEGDDDDYISITPPADSPVALSPEVLKHAPFSFGQAAAMAEAKGTPRAKGKGAIVGLSPLSKLHKEVVHRAVSPTYAPHDPKHGAWAG